MKTSIVIAAGALCLLTAPAAASPRQYNRGYHDCLAGRYDEDEARSRAYRDGCRDAEREQGRGGEPSPGGGWTRTQARARNGARAEAVRARNGARAAARPWTERRRTRSRRPPSGRHPQRQRHGSRAGPGHDGERRIPERRHRSARRRDLRLLLQPRDRGMRAGRRHERPGGRRGPDFEIRAAVEVCSRARLGRGGAIDDRALRSLRPDRVVRRLLERAERSATRPASREAPISAST